MSEFLSTRLSLHIAGTAVVVTAWYKPTKDKDRHRVRLQDMEASNPVLLRVMLAESLDHIQRAFKVATGYTMSRTAIQSWIEKIQPQPVPAPGGGGQVASTTLSRCPRCQGALRLTYDLDASCLTCGYVEYAG